MSQATNSALHTAPRSARNLWVVAFLAVVVVVAGIVVAAAMIAGRISFEPSIRDTGVHAAPLSRNDDYALRQAAQPAPLSRNDDYALRQAAQPAPLSRNDDYALR
jgi:hypothetical protein